MPEPTREVSEPVPASALVVDLRNFSSNLTSHDSASAERARFCGFLADLDLAVLRAAETALPPSKRAEPPLFASSTGDGALLVFLDPDDHARHAALAAFLLRAQLVTLCETFNATGPTRPIDFGIGVELGHVRRVGAAVGSLELSTVIGRCINAAARVEGVTKDIYRTDTILCARLVARLTTDLLGEDYDALTAASSVEAGSIDDAEYLELEGRMVELNRTLCLSFLHLHHLRGFTDSLALFRVSRSSAVLGNPRFERLLALLAPEPEHLEAVRALLGASR